MNAQPQEEFCPCCGAWVACLDERTGWCEACHRRRNIPHTTGAERHCNRCGTIQPIAAFSSTAHYCRACETDQKRRWRMDNAEREAAYQSRRARGRCSVCLQLTWLTAGGVLTNHMYRMRRAYTGQRCAGSRQPPLEGSP